jgi:Peptidase family M28
MMRIGFGLLGAALLVSPVYANKIDEDDLRPHIEILASDDFEGRQPGTEGERKTVAYISDAWAKAGLKPAATNGSWYDPVSLARRGPESAEVTFRVRGEKLRFVDDEMVLVGKEPSYSKDALPLWFAGYGVNAEGVAAKDVAGKAVLFLADRPAFGEDAIKSLTARRQALIAAGAEAVIAIGGEQTDYPLIRRLLLARPITMVSREKRAPLEGVVGAQFAVAMVTASGGDWDKLRKSANSPDFAGSALGVTADFNVKSDVSLFDSSNVIGKISGKKPGSGAILYMGHWDHLGLCRPEGDADRICNGAVDNASGIAVMTEVARDLAKSRHDRDIYFVATTAEESGLYGAYAFAENPPFPLEDIVVALNIDTIAIAPKGAKVAIIGRGTTKLDPIIESVARKSKRKIEGSTDANAFIRRQDGWALTQKGVPALMVGGSFADLKLMEVFLDGDYHGPEDELTETTELGGAAEDANLHVALGKHFASTKKHKATKEPIKTGG